MSRSSSDAFIIFKKPYAVFTSGSQVVPQHGMHLQLFVKKETAQYNSRRLSLLFIDSNVSLN
jgi:hypothetical protein